MRGLTVFFTGLSGAGKSTTAARLQEALQADGRQVTLLDGDAVRKQISRDLGFSRQDREENIRRVAEAAAGIMKRGEICICAAIAPYDSARKKAREIVAAVGDFVLVYMKTPLEVCEARDPRGLYAKARSGELQHFTGVSDPYEPPSDAEVVIDTTNIETDAAVESIKGALRGHL